MWGREGEGAGSPSWPADPHSSSHIIQPCLDISWQYDIFQIAPSKFYFFHTLEQDKIELNILYFLSINFQNCFPVNIFRKAQVQFEEEHGDNVSLSREPC